jgi:hypothetical protein
MISSARTPIQSFYTRRDTGSILKKTVTHIPHGPSRVKMTAHGREPVSFITTEADDDLVVAFAISLSDPGEIASLILQRTPKFEFLLLPEERGLVVSHEAFPDEDRELATRIVVNGSEIDIDTTVRTYRIDISAVDPEEVIDARKVLRRMHRFGGFRLDLGSR